jgi:hypothetical protein
MIQYEGSNFLTFDVCLTRTHEGSSEITQHPVEDGANIADHVRPNLDAITIEWFVSNAPIAGTGSFSSKTLDAPQYHAPLLNSILQGAATAATAVQGGLTGAASLAVTALPGLFGGIDEHPTVNLWQFDAEFDAVKDTLDQLRIFKRDSTILTVITPEHTYENMVLESFSIEKNHENGTGASVTMGLKQLLIVQTQTVTVPSTALPRAKTPVRKGAKAPVDAGPVRAKSLALALVGG